MATVYVYVSSSAGVDVVALLVSLAGVNPSYEIVGAGAGQAQDWTEAQDLGGEAIAEFAQLPWEGFECGFANNGNSQSLFALTDLQLAMFEAATQGYESFDHSWNNNHFWKAIFAAGDLKYADFDGEGYEDFEDGWGFNENSQLVFAPATDLDVAQFNTATVDYECFDAGWDMNHASSTVPIVTYVNYDSAAPESVEDFEEEWVTPLGI